MANAPSPKKAKPAAKSPAARSTAAAAPARRRVDWDAVERDYRTGKFTQRELADKYGVVHGAIGKQARAGAWEKDLTAEIRQATNARLVSELVSSEVAKSSQEVAKTVLVAAEANAQVILGHRTGLKRITSIKETLLNQIEQAAQNLPDLAEVIELVRSPDENGQDRANDALKKALSRTALVDDLKKLAEVDERVRKGEREAFNIDAKVEDPDSQGGKTLTDAERAVRLMHFLKGATA